MADAARQLRARLRDRGLKGLGRLTVAATAPGRLSVRIADARDRRLLARGAATTDPTAATTLRLRLTRRGAHPRAVIVRLRHPGATERRLVVRLRR
jgi:hypothetical protein